MTNLRCPLPNVGQESLFQGTGQLAPKCRKAGCGFVDSDHNTDWLPSSCILLVVSLLESKKEPTE